MRHTLQSETVNGHRIAFTKYRLIDGRLRVVAQTPHGKVVSVTKTKDAAMDKLRKNYRPFINWRGLG